MTKTLFYSLTALFISSPMFALGPNDVRIQQRDPTNMANLFRDLPIPSGGASAIIGFNGGTVLPQLFLIGNKLSFDGTTINLGTVLKSDVGLGNADNTADLDKPISTATQTALNAKANASSLSTVATSGAYADLSGRPTIVSAFTNDAGYITIAALSSYATTSSVTSGLAGKFNNPAGTTAQYIRGDGSLAALPTVAARAFNNAPGRALVSVAAAANGFQVDASRDAIVNYSVTIATSSTLAGGQSGYVALEINTTNSTTGWVEISRASSGQTNGLVVGLTLNQVGGGNVSGVVPAGYYARIRTVNSTGVPTYTINSQQEVKL